MRLALFAAVIGLLATPAVAQHHSHGGPGFHLDIDPSGPDVRFGGTDHDRGDFHGRWVGFDRHFWHGRWYDYGVGSCWAPGPDGRWWWICD